MPLTLSPVRLIKEAIKEDLLKDPLVMAYLGERPENVQTARYSDIGEQDLPLCLITAVKEELSRLSQDYDERSDLSLVVEFHGYASRSIHFDDFVYHVRRKLSELDLRLQLGPPFESLKIENIVYNRGSLGTKNLQQVSFEVKTFYEIELNDHLLMEADL